MIIDLIGCLILIWCFNRVGPGPVSDWWLICFLPREWDQVNQAGVFNNSKKLHGMIKTTLYEECRWINSYQGGNLRCDESFWWDWHENLVVIERFVESFCFPEHSSITASTYFNSTGPATAAECWCRYILTQNPWCANLTRCCWPTFTNYPLIPAG